MRMARADSPPLWATATQLRRAPAQAGQIVVARLADGAVQAALAAAVGDTRPTGPGLRAQPLQALRIGQRHQVHAPAAPTAAARTGCAGARSTARRPATPRRESCPARTSRVCARDHRRQAGAACALSAASPGSAVARVGAGDRRPCAAGSSRAARPGSAAMRGSSAGSLRACGRIAALRRRCGTATAAGCPAHRSPAPAPARAASPPGGGSAARARGHRAAEAQLEAQRRRSARPAPRCR